MPRFTTAPVEDVAPKRVARQPSQRAQTQQQYRQALEDAVVIRGEALVVELDPEDKPLTIRNRIKRAAGTLGLEVVIRRRKERIIVYDGTRQDTVGAQVLEAQLEKDGVGL